MRGAVLIAAVALATMPSAASSALFGELPFQPVSGQANCLRPTGPPGELSRWTSRGVELATARADGLHTHTLVRFGVMTECPVVVSDPSGFAALAAVTTRGVRIAVREPLAPQGTSPSLDSGRWVDQTTIPAKDAGDVRVAVSVRGDVLVAWAEGGESSLPQVRVRAVRRSPGGRYGAPQRIGGAAERGDLAVGLSASGEGLLVTSDESALRVATAPPGAPFGAPQRLSLGDPFEHHLALAVGTDGRALLAATAAGQVGVFDREPGAAFVRRLGIPAESNIEDLAVALGASGAGVAAWRTYDHVSLVRRDTGAAFGPEVVVREIRSETNNTSSLLSFWYGGDAPPQDGQASMRALVGADGRAHLTWGNDLHVGFVATVDAAGAAEVERVGSLVRDVAGLTPLVLADGTRAIAWADNNLPLSVPPFAGRLHLALEGAPGAPAVPAPELVVGAPLDASLRPGAASGSESSALVRVPNGRPKSRGSIPPQARAGAGSTSG